MTAVTAERPEAAAPAPGPRALVRTVLLVHRSALWFWAMLVAVGAGCMLWATGPGADAAWAEYRAMGCFSDQPSLGCDMPGLAAGRYDTVASFGSAILGLTPFLAAAWAGGVLVGRELENGTARLAWTQSVTPARWLAAKLALPAVLLTGGTLLLTLLHRVMWASDGRLWATIGSRQWYQSYVFEANGTLATAYALLGLAVGALAGLLLGRTVSALGTAVVALAALLSALSWLRPFLWPARTLVAEDGYPPYPGPVVDEGAVTATGARVADPLCGDSARCLADTGVTGYYRDYHPSAHFWPLQLVETGIVLALTAAATLAAFRMLRRRLP
ncbi:ABC transporter transmembrane protein [Streptomyces zinciresistens K42]|uniref:ABC transporter transmembrane protein n=1 Tax=Streptomyces zinciresistens K42 TaxID=700597 RepID=G2GAL7_9ACTN|nr:hypothetical protein [Streptomyces zinciresistens]EGX59464.1 ABC transporter transmembrane protein [Streptomyces zinciresistens K42]